MVVSTIDTFYKGGVLPSIAIMYLDIKILIEKTIVIFVDVGFWVASEK